MNITNELSFLASFRFESALRKEEPQASLPYWDSTLEEGLPNPIDSVIWSDFLFGSVKGAVVTGVAKFWYFAGFNQSESSVLNRNVSQEGMPVSPTLVQFFLSRKKLRELTACVDLTVEQTSRSLHEYVGGTMRNIYYSPQDFLFFLHHAYLDYLWEKFRMTRQTAEERQSDYPSNYESCTKFHYGSAYMRPFPKLKNIDGLNEVYTSRYYKYHDSPTCNSSCESPYLFCDKSNSRCLSKIRPGGNCSGLAISSDTVCFNSHCIKGVCLFTNSTTTSSASDKNETLPTEASLQVFKIKTKELMAHHKLKAIQNGKFKIHYLRH